MKTHFLRPALAVVALSLFGLDAQAAANAQKGASSISASGRGGPWLRLSDGKDLGPPPPRAAGEKAGILQPLGLAGADLNRDGVADAVVAYGRSSGGGSVVVFQGDKESIAPTKPENLALVRQGLSVDPFLPDSRAFTVPVRPDFMAVGDFDRDGNLDIVVAARNGKSLYLLSGDGGTSFSTPKEISLPGPVTALAASDAALSGGTLLALGLSDGSSHQLLIFPGDSGAVEPGSKVSLKSRPTALAIGRLGMDTTQSVAAGMAKGLTVYNTKTKAIETSELPSEVKSLTIGRFHWDREGRNEVAALLSDGWVRFLAPGGLDRRPFTQDELAAQIRERNKGRRQSIEKWLEGFRERLTRMGYAPAVQPIARPKGEGLAVVEALQFSAPIEVAAGAFLVPGKMANLSTQDLLVVDSAGRKVQVLLGENDPLLTRSRRFAEAGKKANGAVLSAPPQPERVSSLFSMNVDGEPVAAVAMRLGVIARDGLVVLRSGQTLPSYVVPVPAAVFTTNTFADPAPPGTPCNGVAGDCSLRGAVIRANQSFGPHSINLLAGTYNLTRGPGDDDISDAAVQGTGDIDFVSTNSGGAIDNNNLTIVGAGAATTIIDASAISLGGDRIFDVDAPFGGGLLTLTLTNMTLTGGKAASPSAAGGDGCAVRFIGQDFGVASTQFSATNVVFKSGSCVGPGGGVSAIGFVNLTSDTFGGPLAADGNTVTAGGGGGLWLGGNTATTSTITATAFTNNKATSATFGTGGGLLASLADATAVLNATSNTFTLNTAQVNGGGAAFQAGLGGTVSLLKNTFSVNTASNAVAGGGGGAVHNAGTTLTMNFNRIRGNTSAGGNPTGLRHASGTTQALNNWWGCNFGPGAAGCDTVGGIAGGSYSPWLMFRNIATPSGVLPNGASTLTSGFTLNSAAVTIAAADLSAFVGLGVAWSGVTNGTLSGQQASIQANGSATAIFTNSNTCLTGTVTATSDTQAATANITANCPELTISKANNVAGSTVFGNGWNWTLTISNTGAAAAAFTAGQTIAVDDLPTTGLTYGSPTVGNATNITNLGNVNCTISSNTLTCLASGASVTIGAATGKFDVVIPVTLPTVNTYSNPRGGGGCSVDPSGLVTETNEGNNACNINTVVVNKANTTAAIISDAPDPSVVGQNVTVAYSVAVTAPGSGTPTGNVLVTDGVNSCTGTVGAGSCLIPLFTPGVRTLTATYQGDANFNAGPASPGAVHQVNAANTAATITSDNPDPSVVGQSVTVNFSVAANAPGSGTPTGNVVVTVSGGAETCTGTVAAGTCTLTLTAAGSRTLTATYAGDASYNGSSDTEPHTVNTANTTATITSDNPDPSVVGQNVTVNFTITVNAPGSGTPTGNVVVTVSGGAETCTGTVAAGTCTLTLTAAGSRTLTATYAGDASYNGSSDTEPHTVNNPGTTTTITADTPDPSVTGQAYTVTASVTVNPPGSGTPTGTVTVSDGTGGTCTITLPAVSCILTSTTAGAKTLTATYAGDANFNGSTSGGVPHTVNKADTTAAITSDAPDPSVVGQSVTVTYSVSVSAPGGGTPTGNVLVTDGVNSCTGTVGSGQCVVALFTPGVRTLTATYQGDANYNASPASSGAGHQVNKASTTTTITADNPDPSVLGQNVTVNFTVAANAPGAGTPTGNVVITISGGAETCTGTVAAGSCTLALTALGNRTLTATYAGDASYNGSASAGAAHTVNKADTVTTITSDNPDSSQVGQNVTVAFVVAAAAPGAGTPTGTVTVTISGGAETCTGALAAGSGSCTLALTSPGGRTLTATYSSDTNFNGSVDTEPHTVVAPPVVSKAFSPSSIPLNGTAQLTFTLSNPAANSVNSLGVVLIDNLPAGMAFATPPLVSTTNCGGLTVTDGGGGPFAAGDTSIRLNNATVVTGFPCVVVTNVTATTIGSKLNTTDPVTSTNGGTGNSAAATLLVASPPTITKAFGAASILLNASTSLTFTINNPNASLALSGVAFTDNLPAGLVVATPNALTSSCGGTVTATAGSGTVTLASGSLAASGNCTISLNVTGTTGGVKNNTTSAISSTESGTGLTSNTATVTVVAPPTISKAFGAATIPLLTSTSLTFNLTNPNATAGLTGVNFLDSLPAGLVVATPNGLSGVCGGAVTATAGTSSVSLAGGIMAAGGACAITVNVTGTTAGVKNNTTSAIGSAEGGTGTTSNTATVTVLAPPTISKAFGVANIALNGNTSLTFTLTNPNATTALTGVAFIDTLPAGLVVATPNGLSGVCAGAVTATAGTGSVSLTGGTIGAAGSCTIVVNVTGTTSGVKNNTTGAVSSTNGGTGATSNTATVTVASPPTITKSFGVASIPLNGSTSLTLNLTNPNSSLALTGVAFSDTLPAGLVVATPNGLSGACGGTVTATAGSGTVTLASGTLAASGTCTISLDVTGTTGGVKNNTTSAISSTESGTGLTSNTATVTVVAPPTISKAFGAASIALNASTSLTFTITNPSATVTQNAVAFSDTLPSGLVVATPNGLSSTCGGTVTATAGSGSVTLSGGSVTSGGACTISVNVTGTTAGTKNNTTGAISSTEGGTGTTSNTATLAVVAPPTVAKAFSPTTIALNGISTLSFTLTNPAANTVALAGVGLVDILPAGVQVAATPGATNSCGGTFTPVAGNTTLTLSGGTVTTGSSCTFSVSVTGTTSGIKNNTTNAVTSTNGGNGNTASATLTVASPPTIAKAFSPAQIPIGGSSTLTLTFTNPNTIPLTGLAVTDNLPAGTQVVASPTPSNTCGGTFTAAGNGTTISLSAGTIASSSSCTVSVAITGTTPGLKTNTTGNVTATESGAGLTAMANLTVVAPPTITKAFAPAQIPLNGTSTLTLTITNPAANTVGLTGIAVSDAFPAGVHVAAAPGSTNTCGGTFAPAAAATTVSLAGGAIATPGNSCVVTVAVTGTSAGNKVNTTGTVSSTEGGTGLTASATLTVVAPPAISKAFSPNRILLNQTSTLTITITSPAANTVGLTGIAVSDAFPAGVQVAAAPAAANGCGGTFTAAAGATTVSLTGGAIASPGGSCTLSVVVTGVTSGDKTNVTGNVTSTEGGTGGTATALLTVVPPPTAAVSGTATICAGQSTIITAVLTGATPWTVTWSDGFVQTVAASPATRTVSPAFNTTYTVTSLTDANYSNVTTGLTGQAAITVKPTPSSVITSAASVCSGSTGNTAAVPDAGLGATYAWTVTNGTATTALNGMSVTFTAGTSGNVVLTVTVTQTGCPSTTAKTLPIDQVPTGPIPTTPANGSTYQGAHVSWSHPGNASYDVYFDTVNPPQRLLVTGLVNNFDAGIPVWFPGVTYYWQVVAKNACGQSASPVQSFTAGGCLWSGQVPVLMSPIAGATNQSTTTTFQWTSVPGAARYDVYLGTTSANVTLYRSIASPQLSATVRLAAGKTYYWKVVATPVCGASGSATSAVQSFTTGGNGFTLTALTPAFVNRWEGAKDLSLTGSGFLATSRLFTEYQGKAAGTLVPSVFLDSFSTPTNLIETLTPDLMAAATRYDVGVTDGGIEEGRLLQALVVRTFTDVTENDWYFESSGRIADVGVMEEDIDPSGTGPQFWPNSAVTRAQMAEYLAKGYQWWRTRSTALTPASCTTPDFPDVPCSHPDWLAIHWIKTWGVTTGAPCAGGGGNCYYPNNNLNRAEMLTFLERLRQASVLGSLLSTVGQTDPGCSQPYPACVGWLDLPGGATVQWPRAEFNVAYADRLTSGCGGTLGSLYGCPNDLVTRAQIGAFLARLLGLVPTP